MATKTATPWGRRLSSKRSAFRSGSGDKRFASLVQLLEGAKGERFVRFAYTTGGTARRGPVTLRARDVERLVEGLAGRPELARTLGFPAEEEGANEKG